MAATPKKISTKVGNTNQKMPVGKATTVTLRSLQQLSASFCSDRSATTVCQELQQPSTNTTTTVCQELSGTKAVIPRHNNNKTDFEEYLMCVSLHMWTVCVCSVCVSSPSSSELSTMLQISGSQSNGHDVLGRQ
eukprot:GHVS01082938.1.p1 GENE.GHVS01082938.1~~GHVS01082938.1.p1  ORF type:complete len:134 (+),score=30.24 GHVS01082938.1:44-445(+)